jgi:hypothetical protein
MSSTINKLVGDIPTTITHHVMGPTRALLAGAGLCYTVEKKPLYYIPLPLLFPSAYVGYHLFQKKEEVILWIGRQARVLYQGRL